MSNNRMYFIILFCGRRYFLAYSSSEVSNWLHYEPVTYGTLIEKHVFKANILPESMSFLRLRQLAIYKRLILDRIKTL